MNLMEGSAAGFFVTQPRPFDERGVTVWGIWTESRSAATSQRSGHFLTQEDADSHGVKASGYKASVEKDRVCTNYAYECTCRDT